ncbi:MAG: hypothetical protein ACK5HR_01855 [Mycoplasmatales bacterium]
MLKKITLTAVITVISMGTLFGGTFKAETINTKSNVTKYMPAKDLYKSGSGYRYKLDYGYYSLGGRWVTSYYYVGYGANVSSQAAVCNKHTSAPNGKTAKAEVGFANDCKQTSSSWYQMLFE